MMKRRALLDWLPVGLLGVACYLLSSDRFYAARTQRGLVKLLAIDSASSEWINHFLRKAGHFCGYAILTLFLVRAIRVQSLWKRVILTITLVVGWCAVDEYRQSFTQFRTGSVHDMLVDVTGALCALVALGVVLLVRRWVRRSAVPS